MWSIGVPFILVFMIILAFSELSKALGSCMALYVFFHVLGFVVWLVSMYTFLENDIRKLKINKLAVSFSIAIHLVFFLFIMPYNIKQLSLLSFIKSFGQLLASDLALNGVYCLLSPKKSKIMAKLLLLYFFIIELIFFCLSFYIIGTLSIIFS